MRFATAMVLVGLTACAGGSTATRTTVVGSGDDADMICRYEARTGSTITHKVCRTREQAAREHMAGEHFVRESRPQMRPK